MIRFLSRHKSALPLAAALAFSGVATALAAEGRPVPIELTNMLPWSVRLLAGLTLLTLTVPRRFVLSAFVLSLVLIPQDQRFIVGGLDFTAQRILILVGAARLILDAAAFNKFDLAVIRVGAVTAAVYVFLHRTTGAFFYASGDLLDTLGLYWIFRQSIRSWDDVKFLAKALALGALLLAPFVFLEIKTGANPFGALSTMATTAERGGKWRCQASFVHPIVLGTFWALTLPLFFAMLRTSGRNILFGAAVAASLFLLVASTSSTPIGALIVVFPFLFLFPKRFHVQKTLTGLVVLLLVAHSALYLMRGQPIWILLAKANFTGSSTGWYRYHLFDLFMKNYKDWWLLGMRDTAVWDPYYGKTWDLTNQYVFQGVRGGLLGLVLFLDVVRRAFKTLIYHFQAAAVREQQIIAWFVFASLVGFLCAFFGIQLYGQLRFLWYLLLAITAFIHGEQAERETAREAS